MRVPQAPYWAIQLYSRGWYESLDVTRRRTSLNNTQTVVDDDGVVRWVISTRDPGCANWLDAGGHPAGMIHFRAVWCDELPEVASEVVPLSRLGDVLPSSHPKADFDDRLADLRVRRATSRRRFAR